MHRRVVLVINEGQYREIVFRIKTTAHLFKLKDAFAEKIGLSRHSLEFKIDGVEIRDEDTAETLQWRDYDKIFVSRKQVRRTQQKTEISRFEEQLQKLKESTRENLVKEIDLKKKNLEAYQQDKAVELEPIEKAMKTMKISMEKMINALSQVKKLHLLEVKKKEAEILIAESELEDFERSDLSAITPEDLLGALRLLETVWFYGGVLTTAQVTAILAMITEGSQGKLGLGCGLQWKSGSERPQVRIVNC